MVARESDRAQSESRKGQGRVKEEERLDGKGRRQDSHGPRQGERAGGRRRAVKGDGRRGPCSGHRGGAGRGAAKADDHPGPCSRQAGAGRAVKGCSRRLRAQVTPNGTKGRGRPCDEQLDPKGIQPDNGGRRVMVASGNPFPTNEVIMTRFLGAALVVVFGVVPARADDKDAKAIVEKGISALGGAEKLGKMNAFTWKAKGTITFYGIENDFTSTVTIKGLDQFKRVFRNDRYTGVVVLDGAKGWRKFGDYPAELEGELLASEKRNVYYQVVPITLVALNGNGFRYEAGGEEKVGDKAAVILKVTGPDGKDFSLSLDKETGLPLKLVGKRVGYKGGEYTAETTFADYKDFDGIKKATKVETKRDGEPFEKWEVTEFKVLDKVEPDTFAEPK